MEFLESAFSTLSHLIWGNWLLFVFLTVGVFYTIITGFVQVRHFSFIVKEVFRKSNQVSQRTSLSSTQALSAAIASCVGSGNIVGVATAILMGGPGSLFWMWFAAFWGMATKFGEIALGQMYRGRGKDGMLVGGPMYYVAAGLGKPWLGALVAAFLFIQNAGATLIQSNTVASIANERYAIPPLVTGIVLAIVISSVVWGGLKRLAKVSAKMVPIMAGLYLLGGLVVLAFNYRQIPAAFSSIFVDAFTFQAGTGGVMGYSVSRSLRYGVTRGLYSNEAGEGSAAVFHSSVMVDHPVRQSLYGVMEVFIDTMLICTMTGLVLLVSGAALPGANATTATINAFATVTPWFGHLIPLSILLFAGTSLMNQWYFGHVSLLYLKTERGAKMYRVLFVAAIIFGCLSKVQMVWDIQDCALGLLVLPNLFALVMLAPTVRKLTLQFFDPKNGYVASREEPFP